MQPLKIRGLKWRPRKNGPPAAYWIAPLNAVKRGCRPAIVHIAYNPDDPDYLQAIAFECERLRADAGFAASSASPPKRRGCRIISGAGTFALAALPKPARAAPLSTMRRKLPGTAAFRL